MVTLQSKFAKIPHLMKERGGQKSAHVNSTEAFTAVVAGVVIGGGLGSIVTKDSTVSEGIRIALVGSTTAAIGYMHCEARLGNLKKNE
jgi:hypothetical protein